jgi:phosphate transport system ATP-binding protein
MELRAHIKTNALNIYYGDNLVLKNVNIEIPYKRITAIIGPSGCGKTTLLKSFNRLIELQDNVRIEGDIIVDEKSVFDNDVDITGIRKKMGLLFQKPQVLPMSIYDNVAYGPRIHGIRDKHKLDQIVKHYLTEVSLWNEVKDRLKDSATKLSVGQQQRLCLARGLANEPEIILGDEPTYALDPISAEKIEKKFLELKERYTVVLVTHILRQAKRLADYIIFVYLGEIIEQGEAEEVFNNPKDKRTRDYLSGHFVSSA